MKVNYFNDDYMIAILQFIITKKTKRWKKKKQNQQTNNKMRNILYANTFTIHIYYKI